MNPNSDQIVHDIRAHFESILATVTGEHAQTMTADAMERSLWQHLLALGRQLLYLFLVWRAQAIEPQPLTTPQGTRLSYYGLRQRSYHSIFGAISFQRPYFYRAGRGGYLPLDAALDLPATQWSDLVREQVTAMVVQLPYRKARELLQRLVGLTISTHTMHTILAEDAADVAAYYAQAPAPPTPEAATVLVVQADGKGVPMRRTAGTHPKKVRLGKGDKTTHKKEAVITALYTCAPRVRTPQAVVDQLFKRTAAAPEAGHDPLTTPHHKHLWVTLGGKDAALQHLATQMTKRDGAGIQHRVALTDGSEPLQQRVQQYCPSCTLVLDFIHVDEYLWQVATTLLGETHPQRVDWVASHALQILSGQTEQVIAELTQLAQATHTKARQRKVLTQVAGYFARNQPYMRYDTYLAQGWPIATGVVEGACRHLVKDRCELSGMRWSQAGAEALLQLRCVYENGDWDAYHAFRRQQRHQRVYGTPAPVVGIPAPCQILALPGRPVLSMAA